MIDWNLLRCDFGKHHTSRKVHDGTLNKWFIVCKYCGRKVVAKSLKKKFCSDSHKGKYSIDSKKYGILNKQYYYKDRIQEWKKTNDFAADKDRIPLHVFITRFEQSWKVIEDCADKIIIEKDKDKSYKILYLKK